MKYFYIYDCSNGQYKTTNTYPISIGNAPEAGMRVNGAPGVIGMVMEKGGEYYFYPKAAYECNGAREQGSMPLKSGKNYLIACNGSLFIMLCTPVPPQAQQMVFNPYKHDQWFYYSDAQATWIGPVAAPTLLAQAAQMSPDTWVTMVGCTNNMCSLQAFTAMAQQTYAIAPMVSPMPATPQPQTPVQQAPVQQAHTPATVQVQEEIPEPSPVEETEGQYICPVCWLHFDAGDVLSIATHPDLMGDPVLGRDAMLRFAATKFNARAQALDAKGLPCPKMACPHCRHELPPRFLELEGLIFSLVGAPSSGKSYFLASFVHEMAYNVAPEFGLAWRDADPTGNSQLNDVSNRLFSASSPQQAYLSKTDLEGALYEEFHRHGRMVKLPKPFVFNLSKAQSKVPPLSLVFYDNAGEHFEPGRSSEDSPGAMHVAVASGIFFLFDPTSCKAFHNIIQNKEDPQLKATGVQLDQQAIIMAETESRITSILNLPPGERIKTPMAVLIGKCDLWESYLSTPEGGGRPLLPTVADGKLIKENVKINSDRLRKMLMKIQPTLCSTAESISENVCYFAVSPLGVSPVEFEDEHTGVMRVGPDPAQIAPRYVCDSMLWMISQLKSGYIPVI